ncbi:hypothetical protein QZH41_019976 [Actinostola sp. cb2023]|nr:hypothetical protein QZH41_019976 [Actinostola sp. cb2023]
MKELHSVSMKYLGGTEDHHMKEAIVSNIITKLKAIQHWFFKQRIFSFTSSSVLIVYEAGLYREYSNDGITKNLHTEVKMIDFSHVYENNDYDTNYQQGITGIIDNLEQCLAAIKLPNDDGYHSKAIEGESL